MRKVVIIFFSLAVAFLKLQAQDIKKQVASDLVKIGEAYSKLNSVSMDVDYKFFPTHDAAKPVDTHQGYYCKKDAENFYMKLYGTVTISNKDVVMVKDDSSMVFLLKKYTPNDVPKLSHEQFGKLLEVCSSVERIKMTDENQGYRFIFKGNMNGMQKVEFYFSNQTFLVTKMAMYYSYPVVKNYQTNQEDEYPKPRLEVEYRNVKRDPVLEKRKFSVSPYLKKRKDKWVLADSYASTYELIDQTHVQIK